MNLSIKILIFASMWLTLKKYIRSGFLWLATLTLLSHTFIPHHHSHDEDADNHFHLCIHESYCSGNNPLFDFESVEDVNCDHEVVSICSINHEEVNIPSRTLNFDYIISVNIEFSPISTGKILQLTSSPENISDYFHHTLPSRGPPAFII
jgi:hypothetical protein